MIIFIIWLKLISIWGFDSNFSFYGHYNVYKKKYKKDLAESKAKWYEKYKICDLQSLRLLPYLVIIEALT